MSASTIQLTPGERGAYGHFFALADPQSTGVVSGNSAVSFFALSGLPSPVLGSIWTFADKDNNGFLTPADFSTALRLIGHAQSGKVVTEDLIQQPGPLPTFKGVTLPPHLAGASISTPSRSSSTIIQPQATGGAFGSQPGNATEIRPEDRARYTRIFAGAGPQHGLLDGEKAKEIFVKSKLPFDKLGAIWTLADTKARGKLDLTDFIVGMHFIQSTMNGSLSSIPTTLPAGLYEKAAGSGLSGLPPSSPLAAQNTGGSASGGLGGPGGYISRQMTGQGGSQFGAPGSPSPSTIRSPPPSLQPQRTGTALFNTPSTIRPNLTGNANWSVSPADKTKADQFFDGLDQDRKGVLEGQAAVPFFMQSGLDEATLAHVWDLSDITQSGSLTRDEFAVAMHLINLKLTGSELPQELPSNLIPPSLRGQSLPQAVNPQETDTQKDLFSLMDDDIDLPVSAASAFAKPAIAPPTAAAPASATTTTSRGAFDSAFDDDFGSSANATPGFTSPKPAAAPIASALSPVPTGTSASGIRSAQPFGDASTEAANQRLALESTQKSLTGLETSKADLTKSNAADAHSIEDLRTRLETVRMRHQTESEAVKALQERQKSQSAELKRLREESVHEESELSRLKAEKDEIEQALMKDREDVREMKSVVAERTKAKEALKAEIEKLKKDARQQKGLVAIGKKQLSQADSDLSKAQDELNAAREQGDVQEHAAHGEVPVVSPQMNPSREAALSPAASIRSNNPFDRFSPSTTAPTQSHTGAFAVGGAAGAVAAGVGAAALSHHDQNEKEGSSTADDPFGLSNAGPRQDETVVAPKSNDAPAGFDDAFGSDLPSSTAPATDSLDAPASSHANVNQSFDDAFADLDQPATSDPTAPEATSEAIPGSFGAVSKAVEEPIDQTTIDAEDRKTGIATTTSAFDESNHVPAPTADEVAANADVDPAFSSASKGKQVARDEDEDSSDDDDEGPEDFVGHGKHFIDSPDEVGNGKDPISNEDVTQKQPVAENAVQAANRFPEIADEEVTSKAPLAPSTVLGNATPTYTANATPLAPSISGTTDAGASVNDAFHDAATDQPSSESAIPNHDRFTTAIDNTESHDIPTQLGNDQRAISPAKTRRAPPAVPLRSGTANSTSQGGFSSAGPFGTSNDQPVPANSATANPMDDFDAAFEDLGPTTSGNGPVGDVGNVTSTSGFDDTFGEADGFDFVPSFSTNNFGSAINEQNKASTTLPGSTNGGAFDGFDSTFENAFEPSVAQSGIAQKGFNPQNAAPAGQTTSNTGSGFSFDDAFVPAEAISTGRTPPQQSTDLPSAITNAAPTLPARSGSTTNAPGSKESAGALPDDAGPVKQLCSMGFTRPDVIKALEKSNYRTDKALERLLAQA
ncbi:hypothetical protein L7F22_016557 [Adiantum nelumboides]|nr:hypothetical protein [Adiantum nelumboides]